MLVRYDGNLSTETSKSGTLAWKFQGWLALENREATIYVTDPNIGRMLVGWSLEGTVPRMLELDHDGIVLASDPGAVRGFVRRVDIAPDLDFPCVAVTACRTPSYSYAQATGGEYFAAIHPDGDTSKVGVAELVSIEEKEYLFASDSRFDEQADAFDEARSLASLKNLTLEGRGIVGIVPMPSFG